MNKEFNPVLNIPYPSIKVERKNPELAYKIFELYAGRVSELSAVCQYSFQDIYLNEYKELSEILKSIAMVEMRHVSILGKLIEALGLIPYYVTYKNNKPIPWNSDYVDFTTNYRNMLVNDIRIEKEAINDYEKIINMTNDPNVKNIINRIILDEKRHIEIFSKLLLQYDNEK